MSASNALKAAATGTKVEPIKGKGFAELLSQMKPQLAAALPKHITPDRMIRIALTCYRMTPKLRECTQESVLGAVVQCAQLGLEPGLLGQAYLIPFKKKWKDASGWHEQLECQFMPGYRGLIALARRSGEVTSINAELVHENDEFELTLGVDPKIVHKPKLDGDRGKVRLVYGVAKFKDGGYHLEWMSMAEVQRIRSRSKAKDDGPWVTDENEMIKKTLVRRMSKYLPMSVEMVAAVTASDAADLGKALTIDHDLIAAISDDSKAGETEGPKNYEDFAALVEGAGPGSDLQSVLDTAQGILSAEDHTKLRQHAEAVHGGEQ